MNITVVATEDDYKSLTAVSDLYDRAIKQLQESIRSEARKRQVA